MLDSNYDLVEGDETMKRSRLPAILAPVMMLAACGAGGDGIVTACQKAMSGNVRTCQCIARELKSDLSKDEYMAFSKAMAAVAKEADGEPDPFAVASIMSELAEDDPMSMMRIGTALNSASATCN